MPLTVAPWRSYVLNDDEEETSFVLIYYDHVQGNFFNNEHQFSTITLSINILDSYNYQICFTKYLQAKRQNYLSKKC